MTSRQGIGLCRTEHMFFEDDRIQGDAPEMILTTTGTTRSRRLKTAPPYQRDDFMGIFKAMKVAPVTIA